MSDAEKKVRNGAGGRLLSLDALRGFDMFFIMGGAGLIATICHGLDAFHGLENQMTHVDWIGLRHHDTIFPLFLFLAGVSWPFSLAKQLEKGRTSLQIHLKILFRAAILFVLGFAIVGGFLSDFSPTFRIPSVLGHIGVCWAVAALVFLHVRSTGGRLAVAFAGLFAYYALFQLFTASGAPAGADHYSLEWNVVNGLDRLVMPNHLLVVGKYDPESLFSALGGFPLAIFGTLAGDLLRRGRMSGGRKALILAAAAVVLAALSAFFVFVLGMPVIKKLWTGSFVLAAAAYSSAMLALFYWIVDVKGWTRWAWWFRVIGVNSITIYLAQSLIGFGQVSKKLFGGCATLVPEQWTYAVNALAYVIVCWLFLWMLDRSRIYLKV